MLALAGGVVHAKDDRAVYDLVAQGLLDDDLPQPRREALLDQLRSLADDDDSLATALLGTLYGRSPQIGPSIVERDLGRAYDLLVRGLHGGHMMLMPKLVYVSEARGDLPTATAWAQIYARFITRVVKSTNTRHPAEMIVRLSKKMPGVTEDEVTDMVDRHLAIHGDALDKATAIYSSASAELPAGTTVEWYPHFALRRATEAPASVAEFIVEISPKGRTTRCWLVDSYPDPTFGPALFGLVRKVRYSRTDARGSRYALGRYYDTGRAAYQLNHRTAIRQR